ncbi:Apoptosis-inducing factor 2 [Tolypocladium ophioglossoides CBS 100239]|uniref:Apoptosis-inducing factor 2 n=1 Tax=Tolypocladium ophioglossoides (strain CBS 100239) TaxID=1163406 RepID=A0A0L0NGL5_TOLOC|nr:Apoptosis-inducing factor 2 [Tolypocladium ophioglossoides CBS 100239]
MLQTPRLYAKLVGYIIVTLFNELRRYTNATLVRQQARLLGSSSATARDRNIVVIGASFAGEHDARLVSASLPPRSPYRVVVIEPNSHFQFTWVLPRFCVVKGHEDKAFIPYGGLVSKVPEGAVRWVKDRVGEVREASVSLEGSGEHIPYEMLVVATGSGVQGGLPSRVNETDKLEGMKRLQAMQAGIEKADTVVVVGGGAAGVEVATDAKALYPDKTIVMVHSRSALMHRFGKGLQDAALKAMERLGVETILEERVVDEDAGAGTVTLRSGRKISCDFFINCTGQKPLSDLLSHLSPSAISPTGHIRIKPTLQIGDDNFPNIYACGDVADTKTPNPNARSAMRQAAVVADNIVRVATGKEPCYTYNNMWADGFIKLTLGLDRSVSHIGDGRSELLFPGKETKEELMVGMCWWHMGQKAYEDPYMDGKDGVKAD